jgi:ATP-dependent Lhr-like helicase
VILETYRECLQDVFDLPALRDLLAALRQRRIDLVEVETPTASPYASSLLFDYVATYMYEDDTPLAERRAQALALDRDLLKELLGQEELRDLIDPAALAQVEEDLRGSPKSPDQLHDLLLRRGDLRPGEYEAALAESLEAERRVVQIRVGGDTRLIAAEDAGRYRDAVGAMPPAGLPDAFLESGEDPLGGLLVRYARGRGPFTTAEAAARFGLASERAEAELGRLERDGRLVRGELRPGGTEREWCEPDVLRRLRRASLAALRKEVEPVDEEALGRFLPAWHGIDRRATLREALVPLQGVSLPVSLWETDILRRRVPGFQPAELDQLTASGEVVWVGAGLERVAVYFREDAPSLGRPATLPPPEGEGYDRIRAALEGSALFWFDLLRETGLDAEIALPALWELVWSGEVTNDAWQPLRAARRFHAPKPERRPRRFSRRRSDAITATRGRWAGTAPIFQGDPDPRALAELLLERQGIVTRDGVRGEGVPGGYASVYRELRSLETLGACRRGYFVEGLGGAQFALPGAVERLREHPDEPSPRPIPRSPTERRSRGRSGPGRARPGSPAHTSSCSAVRLRSMSNAEAVPSCRCEIRAPSGCAPPSKRLCHTFAPRARSAWRSSGSTASRSGRPRSCPCSSRRDFSRARAALSYAASRPCPRETQSIAPRSAFACWRETSCAPTRRILARRFSASPSESTAAASST